MKPETQGSMFARWKHNWSRNAFMISLLVHGGFILLAVSLVAIHAVLKPKPEMVVKVSKPRLERRQLEMRAKPQELQKSSARPQMKPRMVALAPAKVSMPVIAKPPRDPTLNLSKDTSFARGMGQGMWGNMGSLFGGGGGFNVNVPKLFSGRCNAQDRFRLLRMNGGNEEVDRAVTRALDWFKRTQNADGSWGEGDLRSAMTGFALLAFMGRCETDKSPAYGLVVNKAINYLVQVGRKNEGKLYEIEGPGWSVDSQTGKILLGGHFPYAQAVAALGLAETLAMTQRADIRPVLEEAVQIMIDGQNKENGGWIYSYGKGGAIDLSVSIWHIQALKSAKLAGIKNPELERSLDLALDVLEEIQQQDGSFPYRAGWPRDKNEGNNGTMTGGALVALQLRGKPVSRTLLQKGVDYILARDMLTDPKLDTRRISVYHWYYNTYAIFLSNDRWNDWNNMFQEALLASQTNEGNWPPMAGYVADGNGPNAETYRTALCTLMLEVYYRYLSNPNL